MYSVEDFNEVSKQLKNRWRVFWSIIAFGVAGVVVSFLLRYGALTNTQSEIVTDIFSLVAAFAAICYFGLWITPVRRYRKFLYNLLNGRTREAEGYVTEIEDKAITVDGVQCVAFMINIGENQEKRRAEDDRLYSYDSNLGDVPFSVGEKVHIVSSDKMVASYQVL